MHQILQWPHLLTGTGDQPATTVDGLEANTLADGFFHLATWLIVLVATFVTVRAWQDGRLAPPWRVHARCCSSAGERSTSSRGLVDHQLLGIHHVRDDLGAPLGWHLGFLAFGALLVVGGFAVARGPRRLAKLRPIAGK